jgi:hypothetical protein
VSAKDRVAKSGLLQEGSERILIVHPLVQFADASGTAESPLDSTDPWLLLRRACALAAYHLIKQLVQSRAVQLQATIGLALAPDDAPEPDPVVLPKKRVTEPSALVVIVPKSSAVIS